MSVYSMAAKASDEALETRSFAGDNQGAYMPDEILEHDWEESNFVLKAFLVPMAECLYVPCIGRGNDAGAQLTGVVVM